MITEVENIPEDVEEEKEIEVEEETNKYNGAVSTGKIIACILGAATAGLITWLYLVLKQNKNVK